MIVGAGTTTGPAGEMTMLQLNVTLPTLFVAVRVKVKVPAVCGVPTMPPPLCRTSPPGNAPPTSRHTTAEELVAVRGRW